MILTILPIDLPLTELVSPTTPTWGRSVGGRKERTEWEFSMSFFSLVVVTSVITWNRFILLLILLPSLLGSDVASEASCISRNPCLVRASSVVTSSMCSMKDFVIDVTDLNVNNKPSYLSILVYISNCLVQFLLIFILDNLR